MAITLGLAMSDREDQAQLALLDEGGRTHRFPMDTEQAAAESMKPTAATLRKRVLVLLREHPEGLTDDEGAELLGVRDRLTFGRRRQELCKAGLAHDTTKRRLSPSGRPAAVWAARP